MKLATYRNGGAPKVGVVDAEGERLFDLAAAADRAGADSAPFASMLDLIDADDAGLDQSPARSWTGAQARAISGLRSAEWNCWRPFPSRARCATACRLRPHIRQSGAARAPSRR